MLENQKKKLNLLRELLHLGLRRHPHRQQDHHQLLISASSKTKGKNNNNPVQIFSQKSLSYVITLHRFLGKRVNTARGRGRKLKRVSKRKRYRQ
jgi:hypothetical protein